MPILFMALLALLVFLVIGALLCAAVVSESRQRTKAERQQAVTSLPRPSNITKNRGLAIQAHSSR